MGFDVQAIRFLLAAHRSGVSFARTATIGRQEFFIHPAALSKTLESFGVANSAAEAGRLLTESQGFAEPLLRWLGAEHIVSIDASAYEGASVTHDLNLPIPESLKAAFSVVIDGGTLEHVFNFPVAIKNCMDMVEPGGRLLLMTPANNFMGHGFYQFSPELFFRLFSEENGFEIKRAVFCETAPGASWYEVVDPARAGRRVELITNRPAYLLVQARKLRQVPTLVTPPQQSDYTVLWREPTPQRPDLAETHRWTFPRIVRGLRNRLAIGPHMREWGRDVLRPRPDPETFVEVSWLG